MAQFVEQLVLKMFQNQCDVTVLEQKLCYSSVTFLEINNIYVEKHCQNSPGTLSKRFYNGNLHEIDWVDWNQILYRRKYRKPVQILYRKYSGLLKHS